MATKKKNSPLMPPYQGKKGMVQITTPEGTRWEKEDYSEKGSSKKRVAGKIRTGAGASGRTGKYVGGKNRPVKKRVAGK
jgi:hypothetical protein